MQQDALATMQELSTPATRFIRFLRTRIDDHSLSLEFPTPYSMMLIDYYFGTKALNPESAPSAITYELEVVTPASGQHGNAPPHFPGGAHTAGRGASNAARAAVAGANATFGSIGQRITLNRYLDLSIGSPSADFPDPDIVIPIRQIFQSTGILYRISQRHATLSVPPQYSDLPLVLRALRGSCIYVNDRPVPEEGTSVLIGDVVNFGDQYNQLLYKVRAVHPFALDI